MFLWYLSLVMAINNNEDNDAGNDVKKELSITHMFSNHLNIKKLKPQHLNISYSLRAKLEADYSHNGIACFIESFPEFSSSMTCFSPFSSDEK